MRGDRLGEFEELTLLAIRALDPPAYAVPIQRFIAEATGRDLVMGAVYASLDRLEQKGLVRSTLGEATQERGGKRKRLFVVTAEGARRLKEVRRVRERIWRAIEAKRCPCSDSLSHRGSASGCSGSAPVTRGGTRSSTTCWNCTVCARPRVDAGTRNGVGCGMR
jgi:PadR family transcriptional regulator PadR